MKLLNFTIIKLCLCLVSGILIGHYFVLDFNLILSITIGLTTLVGLLWFFRRSKIDKNIAFGLLAYIVMTCIGAVVYNIQDETLSKNHYSNIEAFSNRSQHITFKIRERLKPDLYNSKYIVSVVAFNNNDTSGKLLININHDSLKFENFKVDDVFSTSAILQKIQKPLNPHQFDYAEYLELRQVHHQMYLNHSELFPMSNSKSTIYGFADALRSKINLRLIEAGFKDDVLSIINALLLGQKQTIDKEIYNNYVDSGTIHILAVSGLHVGIILLILNFLFRPLLYIKYGHFLRPFIIVILLWCFAIIAGLSPSVTRAVTMFSIISVAMHLKRPTNIYNTLIISAFIILLFKPTFLFEVGFQMSYLAVLGIVSVQPIIYKLWKPKWWLVDKFWQIFTVTLAAQAGVVPISLFYFHQFPGLFFISNLVVIPFLGLILGFGIFTITLALINFLPEFVVDFYSYVIESLNGFIAWVAQFEDFLFRDIPFTIMQVILAYLIIVAMVQVYKYRNFKWTAIALFAIIGFQSLWIYDAYFNTDEEFIVFNKSRYSMIGHKQHSKLTLYHNLDTIKLKSDNVIKNYKVGEQMERLTMDSLHSVYQFNNQTMLVIDSLGVYKSLSFQPEYILLRNSPRLNINRLIDSLKPKHVIADASNYKSYVKRWKATCKNKKIPFHQTNEMGAFILTK
ncbi:ComEC/Rec2 family competence protein [Winogradskyella ursingii]|uniref:ComEC/Rec2 family competence protein n=1 Tax=Winogradskyella ursingii TaxID=2686079 RepID=UPI0015C8894A|nr:ComEC/Rec2 family competence protein [Winogradskyella ursingii]